MALINKDKKEEIRKAILTGDTGKIAAHKKMEPLSENAAGAGSKQATRDIWTAASNGDLQWIKDAIARGQDVDEKRDNGRTALMDATQSGKTDAVELLTASGADVDARDHDGETALFRVCWGDVHNKTPAYTKNYQETLEILIEAGADLNLKNKEGYTALMVPIVWGKDAEIVELLLDAGANPNEGSFCGDNPLQRACLDGKKDLAELLLDAGADPRAMAPKTRYSIAKSARQIAADKFRTDIVDLIDAEIERRESKDKEGEKSRVEKLDQKLLSAIVIGDEGAAQLALRQGANPNCKSSESSTPLHLASYWGRKNIVDLLLKHRAHRNPLDTYGRTPLMLAAQRGEYEVVRALLSAQPDFSLDLPMQDAKYCVNATDNNGWTAAAYAEQNGHDAIYKLLRQHGATG